MASPLNLRDKMQKLSEFIIDAEMSVRSGKMVDMSGLDKDVNIICAQATSLPPAQAMEIQPLMAELIGNVERLSIALRDYKAARK